MDCFGPPIRRRLHISTYKYQLTNEPQQTADEKSIFLQIHVGQIALFTATVFQSKWNDKHRACTQSIDSWSEHVSAPGDDCNDAQVEPECSSFNSRSGYVVARADRLRVSEFCNQQSINRCQQRPAADQVTIQQSTLHVRHDVIHDQLTSIWRAAQRASMHACLDSWPQLQSNGDVQGACQRIHCPAERPRTTHSRMSCPEAGTALHQPTSNTPSRASANRQ